MVGFVCTGLPWLNNQAPYRWFSPRYREKQSRAWRKGSCLATCSVAYTVHVSLTLRVRVIFDVCVLGFGGSPPSPLTQKKTGRKQPVDPLDGFALRWIGRMPVFLALFDSLTGTLFAPPLNFLFRYCRGDGRWSLWGLIGRTATRLVVESERLAPVVNT